MQFVIPDWAWGGIFVLVSFCLSLPFSFLLAVWFINRRIRKQTEQAQALLQQMYRNNMH